ncbi:MAG: sugar phosphate isomerase/epimerase [Victivallales bacterium]|nr:sugar phosphate isomerase/epimerase [Victivallales bacterium]
MDTPITYMFEFQEGSAKMRPFLMQELASAGIKHIVLTDALMKEILGDITLANTLKQEAAAAGLSFVDSHALFGLTYDLMNYGDSLHNHRMLLNKLQLNIAAEMGINTITFHPGNESARPETPLAALMDNVKRSLDEMLPEAEKCGVTLCIENSWNQISVPKPMWEIKNAFSTEYLGFCYDSGHANIMSGKGRDNQDNGAIARWKARGFDEVEWNDHILEDLLPGVVNCHLHDNNAVSDQHLPPGQGNIDWKNIASLLKRAPRLKCIQSEVKIVKGGISFRKLSGIFNNIFNNEE